MTDTGITQVLERIAAGNTLEALESLYSLPGSEDRLTAVNRVLYSPRKEEEEQPAVQEEWERHQRLLQELEGVERAPVLYNLGCLALYRDETVDARLYFQEALEADPALIPARHNLAYTTELLADWDEAERGYRQVLEQAPDFVLSRLNLGLLLLQAGRTDEGVALLRALHGGYPENPSLALYLSRALLRTGEPGPAKEVLGLLDALPDWTRYPDLGECHAYARFLAGDVDDAEQEFRSLLWDDDHNAFARLGLMHILAARGDNQELASHALKLHAAQPSEDTANLLDRLQAAGEKLTALGA